MKPKICCFFSKPQRIILFRKKILADKEECGVTSSVIPNEYFDRPSTSITVHRTRIVEDGFRSLASLTPKTMKGLIRVKFVNEQVRVLCKLYIYIVLENRFLRVWTSLESIRMVFSRNFWKRRSKKCSTRRWISFGCVDITICYNFIT